MDISMCLNENCIKKDDCYRYTATPSEYRQSYDDFSPRDNTEKNFSCSHYEKVLNNIKSPLNKN